MKKLIFGLVAIAVLTLTSCKKDEDENQPENVTPTTVNLSASYKLSKVTAIYTGTTTEFDITNSYLPACKRDDVTTLKTDGTFVVVDAGSQCSPPGGDSGNWSLANTTTIIIKGVSFTIKKYNGTNLDISYNDPSMGTVTQYYVKQ